MAFEMEGNGLTKLIAKQVKKEFDYEKRRQEKFDEDMQCFDQTELAYHCKACLELRDSTDHPANVRKYNKGDLSRVGRLKKFEKIGLGELRIL